MMYYCFVIKLIFCVLCCSRSKDVVEPLIKPQWYVDCTEMAKEAVKVRDNHSVCSCGLTYGVTY